MDAVGIVGGGTMGAGVAQVAATNGWDAVLLDVDEATAVAAIASTARVVRSDQSSTRPSVRSTTGARTGCANGSRRPTRSSREPGCRA